MRLRNKLWAVLVLWLALLTPLSLGAIGCGEGPAEEAGETLDETAEEAEDEADDAMDEY